MRRSIVAAVILASLAGPATAEAGSWQPHVNGRALSCMAFAATPVDAAMCYVGAPRFAGSRPMVFAAPQILAGGFSSPPNLIGTTGEGNGFILDSATAPAATNAYVNYDGTNVVVNAPSTKGFSVGNGTSSGTDGSGWVEYSNATDGIITHRTKAADTGTIAAWYGGTAGAVKRLAMSWSSGNSAITGHEVFTLQSDASAKITLDASVNTGRASIISNQADSGTAIGVVINNSSTLSTAGAKVVSFQNNGAAVATVALNGYAPVISGLTESPASATNTALSVSKLVHVVTGTTTISTFTGGTEGELAIVCYTGALTITNSTTDVTNSIHNAAFTSGTAPANFLTTGATATAPYCKSYLFTANMPGFTNGQWFEVGL